MLPFLLLVLLASTAAARDPRCARYKRGAQARTLPHTTDCTKFFMCDIQGNALEMNCPKNTYFSVDGGICTFDLSACTGAERVPVLKPALPIVNKVPVAVNSNNDRVSSGTPSNILQPTLPIISNFNVVGNMKPTLPIVNGLPASESNHIGSGAQGNMLKPSLPIITSNPVVTNKNRTAPENSIGLLKPTFPIISNVPDNNNKDRAAALGPICKNKNNGVKFPMIEDCSSYVICIQQKASVFTCPDGLAYDAKATKCTDTIKCEMPKPNLPSKPTLTRPEQPEAPPQTPGFALPEHPVLPPQNPILPMPELPVIQPQVPVLPVVLPQAPTSSKPQTPVIPPQAPIFPMPRLPINQPQIPVQPKPDLPVFLPQVPTRPSPDLPVVLPQNPTLPMPELPVLPPQVPILPTPELPVLPPQVPILPTPELPVLPPQVPILPTPELPVLPPQVPILPTPELPIIPPAAPILPMPELPVIPADPPKDTISGPIFMPYSAPRLIQDSRCRERTALNSSVMLPAVDDCSKFVVCVGGIAYEKQCPVGQHWSTSRNYCDFIDRAKCSE